MINSANYSSLPINEKAEILWGEGKFIEAIELNDYDVALYSLNNEYIEMYYSISNNQIEKISVMQDPQRLKLYQKNGKRR